MKTQHIFRYSPVPVIRTTIATTVVFMQYAFASNALIYHSFMTHTSCLWHFDLWRDNNLRLTLFLPIMLCLRFHVGMTHFYVTIATERMNHTKAVGSSSHPKLVAAMEHAGAAMILEQYLAKHLTALDSD